MAKKHGNLLANLKRSILPVVLAGAVVALQPVAVLAVDMAVDIPDNPAAGETPCSLEQIGPTDGEATAANPVYVHGTGSAPEWAAPWAAPVLTPHDQNEQAALKQQAMERELHMGAPVAAPVWAPMVPNGNFTAVKNLFRQATEADAGTWGVYSKAANGNREAIWSLYSAAVNGDQNAILALYVAAGDGNPFAIYELQLLGFSL